MAEQLAPARLRNFRMKKFMGCGHWIQLEKRDELSEALVEFAGELDGKV
jgi:pimeloyl-ACP methyl ester carboxylesterase